MCSLACIPRIAGRAGSTSKDPGLKKVIVEVGLDRARAVGHAFENELEELRAVIAMQQERLALLEARVTN